MIRRRLVALATMLVTGCDEPAPPAAPPRDDRAAQIAAEQAAEAQVIDRATLSRLSREVAALHAEVDRLKASRQALDQEMIDARLQALESRTATPSVPVPAPEPVPVPSPAPRSRAADPRRHGAVLVPAARHLAPGT